MSDLQFLLKERDRYRDALKRILRLTDEIEVEEELIDEMTQVAMAALNESEGK